MQNQSLPVLRVLIDTDEVCSVTASELPVEKLLRVELQSRDRKLRFIDSEGNPRVFDLSSAFDEGARCFHMSIRVGPSFAAQVDGVLTEREDDDPGQAFQRGAKSLRLQPFLLPQCPDGQDDLVGRGLFYRGLHFSGMVTSANVSLLCLCDHCHESFRLQSFHAGFSRLVYFYCSGGPHTLVVSSDEPGVPSALDNADAAAVAAFEGALPKCTECGGAFKHANPLLCPHCKWPFIDFAKHPGERGREYYGNHMYGADLQRR